MNCIVTAGPTYEPLDDVRRLTNFSTGRLGTELANFLVARGHQVTLLISAQATYAGERRAQRVEVFTTTANLREKLQAWSAKKVNAVFHAAAVSDFRFGRIRLQSPHGELTEIKSKKFPPARALCWWNSCRRKKIIAELRAWFPSAKLVGWKFEAEGKRPDAIHAAEQQLIRVSDRRLCGQRPGLRRRFWFDHQRQPRVIWRIRRNCLMRWRN